MLDWDVVVNLLPNLAVGMDLVRHGNLLSRKVQVWSPRECAPPPSESTPKGSSQLPLVWATLSELDHFVAALALQQDGQQSALCKGQI